MTGTMRKAENARTAALELLGRRSYATAALRDKLIEKGFLPEDIDEALAWCTEYGYLDDEAYMARVAERQQARGYGPHRVARYLETHGIDRDRARETVSELREEQDGDELARRLDSLLEKLRKGRPWDAKEKKRCAGALTRRGFDWEDISAALRWAQTDGHEEDFDP